MVIHIARVIESLSCLMELPLGEGVPSQTKDVAGLGPLLLSYRPGPKGTIYYFTLDLEGPLKGAPEPDPQLRIVSASNVGVVYGKPANMRQLFQGRRLHCSIFVKPAPEEDVVFQLMPTAS